MLEGKTEVEKAKNETLVEKPSGETTKITLKNIHLTKTR
jgi:hypothetical protein